MWGWKGSLMVTTLVVGMRCATTAESIGLTTTESATASEKATASPQALTSTAKDTTVASTSPPTVPSSTVKAPIEPSLTGEAQSDLPAPSNAPLDLPSTDKAPSKQSLLDNAPSGETPLELSTNKAKPESATTPSETRLESAPTGAQSTVLSSAAATQSTAAPTERPSPTTEKTTTKSSSTSSTTTSQPQYSTEWQDIEEEESDRLLDFVVSEIQKLKVEHRELDECQELDLSSVLSGKKLNGKTVKYSITLKVQPQVKNTKECLKQNSTMNNMHPEICEADVTEGDRGGTNERTLLRSTCLQVEELQD